MTPITQPPLSFVAPELIESARVSVRSLLESDLPSLLDINTDAEVVKHLGHAPWQAFSDAEAWFARISKQIAAGSALEFVIVEKPTAKVIGRCGLFDYDRVDSQASLGYILRRSHWRQGYMREALTGLIGCAFGEMGLRRLEAKVEAPNTASSALLRRLGFTREGVLRERWVAQSGTIDAEVFGLLSHEWSNPLAPMNGEPAQANYHLDFINGDDTTLAQEQFINHWNQHYFGEIAVSKGLTKAPVHWRLILRDDQKMVSHVALTELNIEMDGPPKKCGAVGGLFTPSHLQGRGYGSALMDRAEAFIFDQLELSMGILFCLPELVPFYAKTQVPVND